MEKATTLKEIAFELGLSVNTISRALRDCDDISQETKARVVETAIAMGYMRSSVNQLATKGGKKLIVVITGGVNNLYYSIHLTKLKSAIVASGNNMAVIFADTMVVQEDVIKQCISERADGVVSMCNISADAARLLKLQNIPICFLGSFKTVGGEYVDGVADNVSLDEKGRCRIISRYLLGAHKDCDYVFFGPKDNPETDSFYKLVCEEICDPGKKLPFFPTCEKEKIFDFITESKKVSVVAFSDEFAYELLDYLNDKIPSFRRMFPNFHIVSSDALCLNIKGLVDITSVYASYQDTADKILDLLYSRMKDPSLAPRTVRMSLKLHVRSNY